MTGKYRSRRTSHTGSFPHDSLSRSTNALSRHFCARKSSLFPEDAGPEDVEDTEIRQHGEFTFPSACSAVNVGA